MAQSRTSFKPGQSGNPSGRPRVIAEVRDLARRYCEEAVEGLAGIARDQKAPHSARVAAWTELLNRGYGRAPQSLEVKGSIEAHIIEMVRQLDLVDEPKPPASEDGAVIDGEREEVPPEGTTKH